MSLNKIKKAFLICVLAVSTIISATHHHSDLKPHYDCPICVFQLNNNSDDIDFNPIVINPPELSVLIPEKKYSIYLKNIYKTPNQRAPPSYS